MEENAIIACGYKHIQFCLIELHKLNERIPFLGGYIRFQQKEMPDLDLSTIDLPISACMWAFFLKYAETGEIPKQTFSVTDQLLSTGTDRFSLNDSNIREVTEYADLMMMAHFIKALAALIIQTVDENIRSATSFFSFFTLTQEQVFASLEYFAFLIDKTNVHDDLIDAVASVLATKHNVFQYNLEIGRAWKERHIRRFVNRKKSYFRIAQNVFYIVIAWTKATSCKASLRLELLLDIANESDTIQQEIDKEIVKTLRDHRSELRGWWYDNMHTRLDDELDGTNVHDLVHVLRRDRVPETKLIKQCELTIGRSEMKMINCMTSHKTTYDINNRLYCSNSINRASHRGYHFDVVLSENENWVFQFIRDKVYHKLFGQKINLDEAIRTSFNRYGGRVGIGWQFMACETHIAQGGIDIVQAIKSGKLLIVNFGTDELFVFHEDGLWNVCNNSMRRFDNLSISHTLPVLYFRGAPDNSQIPYCYLACEEKDCNDPTSVKIIRLYAISNTRQMYRRRIRLKTTERTTDIRKSIWHLPMEEYQRMQYPIDLEQSTELPTLFHVAGVGIVCISGLGGNHDGYRDGTTKLDEKGQLQLKLECFVLTKEENDTGNNDVIECAWKKIKLNSVWVAARAIMKCRHGGCTGPRRPLKGLVNAPDNTITLFSGDRQCDYTYSIFNQYTISIDLVSNTVTLNTKRLKRNLDAIIYGRQ